jgi:hypothetical protein
MLYFSNLTSLTQTIDDSVQLKKKSTYLNEKVKAQAKIRGLRKSFRIDGQISVSLDSVHWEHDRA